MLENVARIGTILSLLCLGWLLPGAFTSPRCSKSALVQSFDIRSSSALSRVWNCAIDPSGEAIAPEHVHRLRDLENRLSLLEIVVNWYKLPKHPFRPEFDLSGSAAELETELVESYLRAQPELASTTEALLPRLALAAFGAMEFRSLSWNPLEVTLRQARLYDEFRQEKTRSLSERLRGPLSRAGHSPVPTPSLTVAEIDPRLSSVYATWRKDHRILFVRGSAPGLSQALHLLGFHVLVRSEEGEFSKLLRARSSGRTAGGPKKVIWIPESVHLTENLIQVLNERGTRAFAERSSSRVRFIEMYFPHVKQAATTGRLRRHQPLITQLLDLSQTSHAVLDEHVHQPASPRDLVTLYRWPSSP